MKKHNIWLQCALIAICTAAASVLIFGLLNRYDNKYTRKGVQPISGIFNLTQQELTTNPLHELIRDWECYPGVLLTPAQLREHADDMNRQLISVGQYSGMELGNPNRSPHGSATYRLTLFLPSPVRSYSLAVPEIFSAYRLYIDDKCLASVGQPDPESYQANLRTKTVTFTGEGQVQLVIAVTDQSFLYSGMVYPLTLGETDAVEQLQASRLMARVMVFLLCLVGMILSLYPAVRARWNRCYLFASLCLCLMIFTAYPLIYTFCALPVQPLMPLVITSFYTMLYLIVLLQNSLCNIRGKLGFWTTLPFLAGALAALIFCLLAPVMHLTAMQVFSQLTAVWKLLAAAYLIVTSCWAIWLQVRYSSVLLSVSLFFAFSLVADRVLPLYEPILGGWFTEVSGAVLIGGVAFVLWSDMTNRYRLGLVMEEQQRQMQRQLDMQREHFAQLSAQVETTRTAVHDFRHHIRVLQQLADQNDTSLLRTYLDEIAPAITRQEIATYSGHPVADAVIRYYASQAKQANIGFDALLRLPPRFSLPDLDLCILLSNLLENAVEACKKQKTGVRTIFLRGELADGKLRLVLDNSFSGEIKIKDGRYFSSKRAGYGVGLASVQKLMDRYQGLLSIEPGADIFRVSVMIPLVEPSTNQNPTAKDSSDRKKEQPQGV